jgi:hypothetical protein
MNSSHTFFTRNCEGEGHLKSLPNLIDVTPIINKAIGIPHTAKYRVEIADHICNVKVLHSGIWDSLVDLFMPIEFHKSSVTKTFEKFHHIQLHRETISDTSFTSVFVLNNWSFCCI